jgi:hypothetical protein
MISFLATLLHVQRTSGCFLYLLAVKPMLTNRMVGNQERINFHIPNMAQNHKFVISNTLLQLTERTKKGAVGPFCD